MANGNSDGGFLAGFVIGGLAGFVVGIMVAPKPGEETRAQIWESTTDARDRIEDLLETAQERVDELRDEVTRASETIRQRVASISPISSDGESTDENKT